MLNPAVGYFRSIPSNKGAAVALGVLVAALVDLAMLNSGWDFEPALVAAVTALCAVWWVFEALPIPVTSLVPLAIFPLFGILEHSDVAQCLGNQVILLLLGGFMLSEGVARSGLHRRMAWAITSIIGGVSGKRIVFGFIVAAALMSMWMTNAAAALILLPVALAAVKAAGNDKLTVPILLGICYGANIGGICSPVGTPANLVAIQAYEQITGRQIGFLEWMKWTVPFVVLFIPVMGWWLTRDLASGRKIELAPAGKWSPAEWRVLAIFVTTILLWVTRTDPAGGWSGVLHLPGASDGIVAILAVVIMFIVPDGGGGRLLDWDAAVRIPWGVLLLLAGGLAISKAFDTSGLSAGMSGVFTQLSALPPLVVLFGACLIVALTTEFVSNTATVALFMPMLAAASVSVGVDPALLMVPATITASCGFMMPMGTATNAAIFGSGRIPIREMIKKGALLDVFAVIAITGISYFVVSW